jgi:hypothetical protein
MSIAINRYTLFYNEVVFKFYSCELIICPVLPTPSRADLLNYLQEVDAILWSTQYRLDKEIMDRAGIYCTKQYNNSISFSKRRDCILMIIFI